MGVWINLPDYCRARFRQVNLRNEEKIFVTIINLYKFSFSKYQFFRHLYRPGPG